MANIDLKFLGSDGYIRVQSLQSIHEEDRGIIISGEDYSANVEEYDPLKETTAGYFILLDIPTAIKFAKTLRTEINKVLKT